MRKLFCASPLALCVLGALVLYGCSGNGVSGLTENVTGDQAPQPPAAETQHANGVVQDWSTSHVIFPLVGNMNTMKALQSDVRAMQSWHLAQQRAVQQARVPRRFLPIQSDAHRDWSINLGGGTVAATMYPAKFTFNVTSTVTTANCTSDFAVFPIDVAGSTSQPNIAALDNLYSGTAPGPTGICNRTSPPTGDDGVSATTMWSYNITAAGGIVATSPALSEDGTKVAFVETGTGTTAHFHVLAGKVGDGVDTTTPNAQNVLLPKSITTGFSATAPAAGSGTATDLALTVSGIPATQSDTLSSPFVDYLNDVAYVGNDAGVIFRIKNVFCTLAACTGGGSPAPSLDTSWGTNGALTIGGTCTGASGVLSGVVVDGARGNIFVGCSDGNLYGFTNTGTALTGSPVTVGDGTATGGIVDPPLVDSVTGLVYAVSGSNGGSPTNSQVVVQVPEVFTTKWTLGSAVAATLGAGGVFNLHAPAVNDAYLTGGPGGTGALLYDWGIDTGDSAITIYGIGFSGTAMTSGAPGNILICTGTTPVELSPVTEFDNSGTDQLFVSGLTSSVETNFVEYIINSFPAAGSFPPSGAGGATAAEGNGTSGIIVDNISSASQASSIYFGVLGSGNFAAVKLTQSGLE